MIHFAGVETITDAERLRGLEVQVPFSERAAHSARPPLHLRTASDAKFGSRARMRRSAPCATCKITAAQPESWLLVVETPRGELLIPLAAEICTHIDTAGAAHRGAPAGRAARSESLAMRFDIVTIFPEFFAGPLDYGIVRRAREAALIDVRVQDLRTFTHDRHRTVDDRPFGGGEGMVLKPEPLFEAVESLLGEGCRPHRRRVRIRSPIPQR